MWQHPVHSGSITLKQPTCASSKQNNLNIFLTIIYRLPSYLEAVKEETIIIRNFEQDDKRKINSMP